MPSLARPSKPARSTTATLPYPQEAIPVSIEQLFGLSFFLPAPSWIWADDRRNGRDLGDPQRQPFLIRGLS